MHVLLNRVHHRFVFYALLVLNAFLWCCKGGWLTLLLPWFCGVLVFFAFSKITRTQLAILFATSPFIMVLAAFGEGTQSYWKGTAMLVNYEGSERYPLFVDDEGYPRMAIDQQTRLTTFVPDWSRMEDLEDLPYDWAVRANTYLFGYASNAWTGPLPDSDEAYDLWRQGEQVGEEDLGGFGVNEELHRAVFEQLDFMNDWKITRLDERTLLVGPPSDDKETVRLFLLDLREQEIVSAYRYR